MHCSLRSAAAKPIIFDDIPGLGPLSIQKCPMTAAKLKMACSGVRQIGTEFKIIHVTSTACAHYGQFRAARHCGGNSLTVRSAEE